jgi:hypothetical protein
MLSRARGNFVRRMPWSPLPRGWEVAASDSNHDTLELAQTAFKS